VEQLAGFPYSRIEFDREGSLYSVGEAQELVRAMENDGFTDLLVISHGWNNDSSEAQDLYTDLFTNLRSIIDGGDALPKEMKLGVVGVFWPSKRFAEEQLIPGGGAASLGDAGRESAEQALDDLAVALTTDSFQKTEEAQKIEEAKSLLNDIQGNDDTAEKARARFLALVRSLLPPGDHETGEGDPQLLDTDPEDLFHVLSAPVPAFRAQAGGGGAAWANQGPGTPASVSGGAAGLLDLVGGTMSAARHLANYATYYTMKRRAGHVGAKGLNGLLGWIRHSAPSLRIHLVGHSFGARAVTAAVNGAKTIAPFSLTLLQGAFSHNGFACQFDGNRHGFFRTVIDDGRVSGPICITHTFNDFAVHRMYAIASRLARDDAAAAGGGPDDIYGGMGSNGAQRLADGELNQDCNVLLPPGGVYDLRAQKVHNLLADDVIKGHGDVRNPSVANLLLRILQSAMPS